MERPGSAGVGRADTNGERHDPVAGDALRQRELLERDRQANIHPGRERQLLQSRQPQVDASITYGIGRSGLSSVVPRSSPTRSR